MTHWEGGQNRNAFFVSGILYHRYYADAIGDIQEDSRGNLAAPEGDPAPPNTPEANSGTAS